MKNFKITREAYAKQSGQIDDEKTIIEDISLHEARIGLKVLKKYQQIQKTNFEFTIKNT